MRGSASWVGWLLPPATALVIVIAAVLLLMTPLWMHLAIEQSGATQAFATPQMAFDTSDRTVLELFAGPGTFVQFGPDEAAHLRDARAVLFLFLGLAALSAVFIVAAVLRAPHDAPRWRAVARGGLALVFGVVVFGIVGFLAFDAAFELFHRIFFPGGNWEFPADSNMIRLYPYSFWQLTVAALGVLCVIGGGAVWFFAHRRAA
jgi:integral membrane protein (TIGR01906 family)